MRSAKNPDPPFPEGFTFHRPDTASDAFGRSQAIAGLFDFAARQMTNKCRVCGEFAVVDHHGGWLLTLCNFHLPAARAAQGDTRPPYELTAVPATPQDVEVWRALS